MNSQSAAPSQGSEDSISDSSEQECKSPGNAKSTPSAEPSSSGTGPTPPVSPMYEVSAFAQNQRDEVRLMDVAGALAAEPGMKQQTYLAISESGSDRAITEGVTPPLKVGEPQGASLICSVEVSPAKTSASPESEKDSQENEADSSLRRFESPMTLFGTEDGSSLRTFPDSFPQTTEEISESFSRRWPKSGFTTSLGECWTADTSECPKDGAEFSSLPDVLEAERVPERFYLSQKAAAGILRRAEKRGRKLPPHLAKALKKVAEE